MHNTSPTIPGRFAKLWRAAVPHPAWLAVWLLAFAVLLVVTNQGFVQRLELLAGQERWFTAVAFLGVWGVCVLSLLIAAFQQKLWIRAVWAVVFAVSATVGVGYQVLSGGGMTVFDVISLWAAKHEAGRAAEFYGPELLWPVLVLVATFLVFMVRPSFEGATLRRWLTRLSFVPVIPVVAIAGITMAKEGGGTQALPVQFVPLSVGAVAGVKLSTRQTSERRTVDWKVGTPEVRDIVLFVDESLRADYIDFTPGNDLTPALASLRDRIVDFGHVSSGGNCSHYSNAILRFVADPGDLGGTILENPTIWQYAKHAGYETVYIDAQSAFNKTPGKLQNFMTTEETADIDRLYTMDADVPAPELDYKLLEIVQKELDSDTPKFIYANKNGAHFPYDESYPENERVFEPVMSDSAEDTPASRINSYRNAVRWSVDDFMTEFFNDTDLSDSVMIYTSDHGQVFDPHALSHCTVEDPNPREGLVPLFVSTGDEDLEERFADAAEASGPRTHFSIMPTVLSLMGYSDTDIASDGATTLLEPADERMAFTSGDVFGLFSPEVRWHELDVEKNYLEPQAWQLRISGTDTAEPRS